MAFKGTHYRGWQMQANTNKPFVQEIIQNAMEKVMGASYKIMGCGRTDAGVHASQYFFHFDGPEQFNYDWVYRMNKNLPEDISIFDLIPAPRPKAHTRYDAIRRTYHYHIHHKKNAFLQDFSLHYPIKDLNVRIIVNALELLKGRHDFGHLCISPNRLDNSICEIYDTSITIADAGQSIIISITANRFLKSMVRIIVARLLALGEGRIALDDFLSNRTNSQLMKWKTMAPPQGLYLAKIEYPYLNIPNHPLLSRSIRDI